MTTKEIQEVRKASKDLLELSEKVRRETEVIQACIRELDNIAHAVNSAAYDVGVSAADLSEEEEPEDIHPEQLARVADLSTGVSGLFINRAIDFLAEIGARLQSAQDEDDPNPDANPVKVDYRNRFRLALYALSQSDVLLGKDRFKSPYSSPIPF